MMLSKVALEDATATLTSAHFEDPRHRVIFATMAQLHDDDTAVDVVTMAEALKKSDQVEASGGIAYVGGLQNTLGANHGDYTRMIQESHSRRVLAELASEIAAGVQRSADPEKIIDHVETRLSGVGGDSRRMAIPVRELVRDAYLSAIAASENPGTVTGVPTGFSDLDMLTAGLHRGDLFVIGARPSMGKTALALNMAVNAAREGKKVAIFSLEMSKESLMTRLISGEARVNARRLQRGGMSDSDKDMLMEACTWISTAPIWIDDSPGATVREIRRKCRRMKSGEGIDLVMVDYLQLMQGPGDGEYAVVTQASKDLKAMALQVDVPVVALSQLSRELEKRGDKRPVLSDLRSSGQIEQDADVVGFLYRPYVYDTDAPEDMAELYIAKQRNGPTGGLRLGWDPRITRFDEPSLMQSEQWKGDW